MFTQGTPHECHLVATEARTVCNRVVRILLEFFLVRQVYSMVFFVYVSEVSIVFPLEASSSHEIYPFQTEDKMNADTSGYVGGGRAAERGGVEGDWKECADG